MQATISSMLADQKPDSRTSLIQQLTLLQRLFGACTLRGLETAATGAQDIAYSRHCRGRIITGPDYIVAQQPQVNKPHALRIIYGEMFHPLPAYPPDRLQQMAAATVVVSRRMLSGRDRLSINRWHGGHGSLN